MSSESVELPKQRPGPRRRLEVLELKRLNSGVKPVATEPDATKSVADKSVATKPANGFSNRAGKIFERCTLGHRLNLTLPMIRELLQNRGQLINRPVDCHTCRGGGCRLCSDHEIADSPAMSSPGGVSFEDIIRDTKQLECVEQ